ncbi:MAG: UDP-N-acetylmuramate--L-alanine ligase [Bacteroidota bacterium]
MNFQALHSIYFLGIGGIGMSALARYFKREGKQVSGYDRSRSVVTDQLEAEEIGVFFEPDPARILEADLVVYTPAIPRGHPEMIAALQNGVQLRKRAEVLGLISANYRTIAVAGTHGKTTTSTMLAHLLRSAGIDVTAFLGGLSANLNGNFVHGQSEWMVVEADEYDRSFLHLHPEWAIITSLDADHLDIYGDAHSMEETYQAFARQAKACLVQEELAGSFDWPGLKTYGKSGDYSLENLGYEGLRSRFAVKGPERVLDELELYLPGPHNLMNMTAACGLALELEADPSKIKEGVHSFRGIYRRFEVHLDTPQLTYVDDYAHHPKELAAAIGTARGIFPSRKLLVVFQPHLFSRTRDFLSEFAAELSRADEVILLDIYPAREEPLPGVDSEAIMKKIRVPARLVTREELTAAVRQSLADQTVVLTLGAGDLDKEVPKLAQALQEVASKVKDGTNENPDY